MVLQRDEVCHIFSMCRFFNSGSYLEVLVLRELTKCRFQGLEHGSAVKSAFYFSRRPEFGSSSHQHLHTHSRHTFTRRKI